ncbi:hypothetical protein BH23THE1_BH23THE1_24290 [soil metagenome]
MNTEYNNNKINRICLKVSIVEPILLSCIDGMTFPDIQLNLQRVTTEMVLKEYLFQLVDNMFITYNGKKKVYLVCDRGIDLLRLIYIQKERKIVDNLDLYLKVE